MLTDTQCRAAKGKEKAYKLSDSGGLYLHVASSGHRTWRHKYRYGEKERHRVIGTYPAVGLKEAREARESDKKLLKSGLDPITEARRVVSTNREAAADTFETVAREWHQKRKGNWVPVHAADVIESLERDVFTTLGTIPITRIEASQVLRTLRAVENRGAIETAHRLRQRISKIFEFAIAEGRAKFDPTSTLTSALETKPPAKRRPAVLTIEKARTVLNVLENAAASPTVKLANRFLALTAQRPGMVQKMEWADLHGFDPMSESSGAIWIIPAGKMKQEITLRADDNFDHPVPLSPAAINALRQAWAISGQNRWVFANSHSTHKHLSENAISYLYLREGLRGRMVPHGWRATFSTIMNEWATQHGAVRDPLIIDLMLAHLPTGLSESELIYNRAGYIERRRFYASLWADMLLVDAKQPDELVIGPRRRKF